MVSTVTEPGPAGGIDGGGERLLEHVRRNLAKLRVAFCEDAQVCEHVPRAGVPTIAVFFERTIHDLRERRGDVEVAQRCMRRSDHFHDLVVVRLTVKGTLPDKHS